MRNACNKLEKEFGNQFVLAPRLVQASNGETIPVVDSVDLRPHMNNEKGTWSQWNLDIYLSTFDKGDAC